jgi:hypothetical protein
MCGSFTQAVMRALHVTILAAGHSASHVQSLRVSSDESAVCVTILAACHYASHAQRLQAGRDESTVCDHVWLRATLLYMRKGFAQAVTRALCATMSGCRLLCFPCATASYKQ